MTMKITIEQIKIEQINGVLHTIILHYGETDYYDTFEMIKIKAGGYIIYCPESELLIATLLPPLPRNLTADDAQLLHLYAAHGLNVCGTYRNQFHGNVCVFEDMTSLLNLFENSTLKHHITSPIITHASNDAGERVEIAIIDRKNGE